jgi:predicted ATPase
MARTSPKKPPAAKKPPAPVGSLFFAEIQAVNWKNFQRLSVPLVDRVFLIGPNATGKSNFLDIFRFLRDLALEGGGLSIAVNRVRGGVSRIRSLHARGVSNIEIVTIVKNSAGAGWKYELAFNQAKDQAQPALLRERVYRIHADGTESPKLERPDVDDRKDPQRLHQVALGQLTANKEFRELAEFFAQTEYLHLVPQLVKEGANPDPLAIGKDPFGRDLLDQMRNTPPRQRKTRLANIERVLKIVAPRLEKLDLKTDAKGKPHLEVKFTHWRPLGALQNETQFSDGTLRLIGLLWSLQDKGGPLLLEEPELSLHPAVVRKLAPFIHRAQVASGGRQVILSTHSAEILHDQGISPEEILLVRPTSEGSEVAVGSSIKKIMTLMHEGLPASEAALPLTEGEQTDLFDRLTP